VGHEFVLTISVQKKDYMCNFLCKKDIEKFSNKFQIITSCTSSLSSRRDINIKPYNCMDTRRNIFVALLVIDQGFEK